MSVRKIAQEMAELTPNYCEINREERNYAAILFAALCKPDNARRFLEKCGFEPKLSNDFGIYFEYSYLRDLWKKIHRDGKAGKIDGEAIKKEIIRSKLKVKGIQEILDLPNAEINRRFGVGGNVSKKYVEYPGKWAIANYNKNFSDKDDFRKICKFKWAFNIKPDIVIHIDKDTAICIEAKYESGEGSYPTSKTEKTIFKNRGIEHVEQTELQMYMMKDLLGIDTIPIYLVRKGEKRENPRVVYWKEAFSWLDLGNLPGFAKEMVERISK